MKKTTVLVDVAGWGRASAPGWATDVPGLVCAQLELDPDTKKKSWLLFHEDSGRHVRTCATRKACNEFAVQLGSYGLDWTEPRTPFWLDMAFGHVKEVALYVRTLVPSVENEEST